MAACCRQPDANYFSATAPRSKNTAVSASPYLWEQSPCSADPDSCDTAESTLPSPTAIVHPNLYNLPEDDFSRDIKADTPFDLGSFDDWIGWDDPTETALSPSTIDFFPELKMDSTSPTLQQLELQGGARPQYRNMRMTNVIEETTAAFRDDQMDQPMFVEQPRENLYSTPLSWSPPTANIKPDTYTLAAPLTPRQQSRLIAQAMPSRTRTYDSSPSSAASPEPDCNGLKRKSTTYVSDEDDEEFHSPQPTSKRHPPVKKTAHNMIEKRYRTNLNDKIAALRDSVPSLRIVTKTNARSEEVEEDLQGLTPAHKLNKATVLSKATEYISHLERRNRVLNKENATLKSRIEAFEILLMVREPEPQQRATVNQQQMTNGRKHSRQESSSRYKMDGMIQ